MKRVVPVLAVLLILPTSALAGGWKSGGTIFPDGQSGEGPLQATVDDSGAALFAFPTPLPGGGLFVRSRPRGGPMAPRTVIAGEHPGSPDLAGNARGEAVVTLTDSPEGSYPPSRVLAALRRPGSAFDQPQTIVDGASICDSAVAAISNSGYALVVFTAHLPGAPCVVYASVRAPGSAHFDAPVQLSTARSQAPQVAVDDRGNALIAWVDADADGVRVARYLAGGAAFQPSQQLGIEGEESGAPAFGPLLLRVSGPTGAAIIAYPSLGFGKRPAAAIGSTTAGFDRVRLLAGPSSFLEQRIAAAAGAVGTLAVVWRGGDRQARRVKIARVGPGAESITSRDTNTISDLHAQEVAVAIADGGRVTVAWSRLIAHGKREAVEAATCAPSERCGKPQRLSFDGTQFGAQPATATTSTGEAFVTWLTPKGIEWAKAPARTGRFGRTRRLTRPLRLAGLHLYRGRRGAILATVEQSDNFGTSATLLTYGER